MKDKHIIKNKSINKKIRLRGIILRKIMPSFNESKFRKYDKLMNKYMKSHFLFFKGKVEEKYIKRSDGTSLRLLICKNKKHKIDEKYACIYWIHGGGYALGLPEQSFMYSNLFLKDKNTVVIMLDYIKSIEKPYPASLDDSYLGLSYIYNHCEEFNIDKNKTFLGGESAGGGLAISLSLLLKDKKEDIIKGIFPIYPMISYFDTKSNKNNDAPVWNTKSNKEAWKLYLKDIRKEDINCLMSPSLNNDFKGLPPLITYIGNLDPFFDEVTNYVDKLKEAGIEVKIKVFEGCFHAFDMFGFNTKLKKDALNFLFNNYLKIKNNL